MAFFNSLVADIMTSLMSRDNSEYSIVTYRGAVCDIKRGSRFTPKFSFGTFVHVVVVDISI
jgi:hypothetical protein